MSNKIAPEKQLAGVTTRVETKRGKFGSSDQVLDYYLKNTNYYEQTVISTKTAINSVWKTHTFLSGPTVTKGKLLSFWASMALVSALLITVSFTYVMSPIQSETAPTVASTANVLSGLSMILGLAVIVVSVIYTIEIENATTERDLKDFIVANASIFDILTGIFAGSVLLLLVAALLTVYCKMGQTEFIIIAAVSGVVALSGAVFAAIVAGRNRFILWARYGSEEGKIMVQNLQADEAKLLNAMRTELEFQTRQLNELKELHELKELQKLLQLQGQNITSIRDDHMEKGMSEISEVFQL